jgi:hypothetical protein
LLKNNKLNTPKNVGAGKNVRFQARAGSIRTMDDEFSVIWKLQRCTEISPSLDFCPEKPYKRYEIALFKASQKGI